MRGVVTAGPVCPVEQVPPDPACAPRTVPAHIALSHGASGGVVARGTAGTDGAFEISVAPGQYTLSATSPSAMHCTSQDVVVSVGAFTDVHVDCDTGIR